MPEIHRLELENRSIVDEYLKRFPPEVSELTFTNLFVWRKSRPVFFAEVKDSLVFLVDAEGSGKKIIFGNPLGNASPLELLSDLDVEVVGFARIPKTTAAILQENNLHVEPDRDNADYVYRVKDLAELAGRRFHKKRNLIKQCLQGVDCVYKPITPETIPECLKMHERWCKARRCGHDPGLCSESVAVKECLTQWDALPLMGGSVRIDGKIQAFALGETLRPDTAVCHFEKAMPEYLGLGQLINQWFAKHALHGLEFENREQDLGIPGLRQAKKSYYPDHMVEKFRAWFPGSSEEALSPVEPHECGKHEKEE